MRDWNHDPQQLPFASTVQPNTLITLLQDGLAYDELLASAREQQAQIEETEASERSPADNRRYPFVMNRKRRAEDAPTGATAADVIRKRPRLEAAETEQSVPDSGVPARPKPRGRKKSTAVKTNTEENAAEREIVVDAETKPSSPAPEDVDMVDEPPRVVSTLEIGRSIGIQGEPVAPERKATTLVDLTLSGSEILQLSWGRSDSTQLTATGNSIWRSWFITPTMAQQGRPSVPKSVNHAQRYSHEKSFISAIAVSQSNEDVALAIERTQASSEVIVQTMSTSSSSDDSESNLQTTVLHSSLDVVIALRWSETSNKLLVLSVNEAPRCRITVWDVTANRLIGEHIMKNLAFDVAWVSDTQLVICGEKFLELATIEPKLKLLKHLDHEQELTHLRWDRHTRKLACISYLGGSVHLVDVKTFAIESSARQPGQITAIEWQPIRAVYAPNTPRILATASMAGSINVWDARGKLQLLHQVIMGNFAPAGTISFSPDGQFIAGAGDDRICIWRSTEEEKLIAYQAPGTEGWRESKPEKMDVEGEQQPAYTFGSLSWNANGSQLAYSNGDKLRVVSVVI